MKIEYDGLKLDIRFTESATQCGVCEERGLYEREPSDLSVATKEGEANIVLYKCAGDHIYATLLFDDEGELGDFLVDWEGQGELPTCCEDEEAVVE
tara:strand:+ start:11549 stop:11836 length:288 start_codon:yes stop_codon:yes gene_type:complete